jgi:hypothetical protein
MEAKNCVFCSNRRNCPNIILNKEHHMHRTVFNKVVEIIDVEQGIGKVANFIMTKPLA